jgi:argininosuccinate lyase
MSEGHGDGDGPEKLWGGRFRTSLDPAIADFTSSLAFDRRLAVHDAVGSLAHARALMEAGVLDGEEGAAILRGLSEILDDLEDGELQVDGDFEDVHSWLEARLVDRIGEPARRLRAGRSRNDQTAVALRLYLRARLPRLVTGVADLAETWARQADDHRETWMPGYTHLQHAQPVTLGHHLSAHAFALLADGERLVRVYDEAGRSPLGAAALAGTSHPVDLRRTAELLGLEAPYPNTLLAVADRDYVASALFATSLVMLHLSRWAEEVILWCGREFGFASLGDRASQGSSLMPQKRNPEAVEILRGKAGRVCGRLAGLLMTLKALPLAYDSDLQEDKEPLFDALDTTTGSLRVAGITSRSLTFHPERMEAALEGGHLTATDLADHLVRGGTPFGEAHRQVGRAVLEAERRGCDLAELPDEVLEERCPGAGGEAGRAALDVRRAVRARNGHGGPAPERVAEQAAAAVASAETLRSWAGEREPPPIYRAHAGGRLLEDLASGEPA